MNCDRIVFFPILFTLFSCQNKANSTLSNTVQGEDVAYYCTSEDDGAPSLYIVSLKGARNERETSQNTSSTKTIYKSTFAAVYDNKKHQLFFYSDDQSQFFNGLSLHFYQFGDEGKAEIITLAANPLFTYTCSKDPSGRVDTRDDSACVKKADEEIARRYPRDFLHTLSGNTVKKFFTYHREMHIGGNQAVHPYTVKFNGQCSATPVVQQ